MQMKQVMALFTEEDSSKARLKDIENLLSMFADKDVKEMLLSALL